MLGYIFKDSIVQPTTTKVISGNELNTLMEDENFKESWDSLYASCPWATIFQDRKFIFSWYKANQTSTTPLVILSYENSILKGVLPLVIDKPYFKESSSQQVKINGAGKYDAEYQAWLCSEEFNYDFIHNALTTLFTQYPNAKLSLRFIPRVDLACAIVENPEWKKYTVMQKHHRPLMDFKLTEETKLFRKRHLKAKYNRICRAGKLEFIKVSDINEFKEILDEILVNLDFRQAAMFNKMPSKNNPNRSEMLISLFERDILHVTALKLDGETISSIIGMKGSGWMHLAGLISYSSFHSKYSPGLVHLFLLGQMLQEEGYEYFDLTPGYDAYKERVSTSSDEVVELNISKVTQYGFKKYVRKKFHKVLLNYNIRPMTFDLKVDKFAYLVKGKSLGFVQSLLPAKKQIPQGISNPEEAGLKVNRNKIKDLMKYDSSNTLLTRWEFLENAFGLISKGEYFYSFTDDKDLLAVVWFQSVTNDNGDETGEIKISDSYIHPSIKKYEKSFMDYVQKENPQNSTQKNGSH